MIGRPLKFKTIQELEEKIEKYFSDCNGREKDVILKNGQIAKICEPRPYTITGLALALDTSRETLLDYEETYANRGETEEEKEYWQSFSDAIKKAKLRCQNYAEEQLFSGKQATGSIFNLKNNYKWKDETQSKVNLDGNLSLSKILDKADEPRNKENNSTD